jgi:hypothetical protein
MALLTSLVLALMLVMVPCLSRVTNRSASVSAGAMDHESREVS